MGEAVKAKIEKTPDARMMRASGAFTVKARCRVRERRVEKKKRTPAGCAWGCANVPTKK